MAGKHICHCTCCFNGMWKLHFQRIMWLMIISTRNPCRNLWLWLLYTVSRKKWAP